jgi:hypothetical protein
MKTFLVLVSDFSDKKMTKSAARGAVNSNDTQDMENIALSCVSL